MQPPSDRGNQALSAGLTWAVTVALFVYGGHWLDGRLGSSPWLMILGAVTGTTGGAIHFLTRVAPGVLPFGRNKPTSSEPERSSAKPDADA